MLLSVFIMHLLSMFRLMSIQLDGFLNNLEQGDVLSAALFLIYINDLALQVKGSSLNIKSMICRWAYYCMAISVGQS